MTIKTEFINPPIPNRSFDWTAFDSDNEPDGPAGYGETEALAIADLLQKIEDDK